MEKVSNNIKFWTFVNILRTYSNKEVSISIKEINDHMKEKLGITLDRRTLYSYIKDMRHLGMKVSDYDKEKEGYFLIDDFFKDWELKLLMDSVRCSDFITKKKTEELLHKISNLNYIYKGEKLESDVFIDERGKIANEEIYKNINLIQKAIKNNRKITFNYLGEKGDVANQIISKTNPIGMINDHTNYYLISIHDNSDKITTFRIDKIQKMTILKEKSRNLTIVPKHIRKINPSEDIDKNFEENVNEYLENGGYYESEY